MSSCTSMHSCLHNSVFSFCKIQLVIAGGVASADTIEWTPHVAPGGYEMPAAPTIVSVQAQKLKIHFLHDVNDVNKGIDVQALMYQNHLYIPIRPVGEVFKQQDIFWSAGNDGGGVNGTLLVNTEKYNKVPYTEVPNTGN